MSNLPPGSPVSNSISLSGANTSTVSIREQQLAADKARAQILIRKMMESMTVYASSIPKKSQS